MEAEDEEVFYRRSEFPCVFPVPDRSIPGHGAGTDGDHEVPAHAPEQRRHVQHPDHPDRHTAFRKPPPLRSRLEPRAVSRQLMVLFRRQEEPHAPSRPRRRVP